MSRRTEEQSFGSDSFLDVVANVVGILIILIVIVGLRVSRAPVLPPVVVTEPTPFPAPPVAAIVVPPAEDAFEPEPEPLFLIEPAPAPPRPRIITVERPLPALPDPSPPAELVARVESLRESVAEAESARKQLAEKLQDLQRREPQLRSELESTAKAAAQLRAEQERERQELAEAQADLQATVAQLARLKESLATADQEPAASEIQHRINPIGRQVTGKELHFYLSKGTVAHVPVDQLASRLKLHIERQKELLAKMDRYEGSVDPIAGFRMQYVIEKSRLSFTEELKYGQNLVRMQVTQWVLLPEPGLKGETAEQATQRGSDFYQSLLTAGPTTSLTFWVYPDSFETCARLKEFAHRHGYEVAARPLPEGVPITGSPDGSKSVAQ